MTRSLTMQLRTRLRTITESSTFDRFFLVLIVLNTLAMAVVYNGMPDTMSQTLDWFNSIFTFVFVAEVVLKMVAMGPFTFMSDAFNGFDLFVVAMSMVLPV
jgi:Ion transport protein